MVFFGRGDALGTEQPEFPPELRAMLSTGTPVAVVRSVQKVPPFYVE